MSQVVRSVALFAFVLSAWAVAGLSTAPPVRAQETAAGGVREVSLGTMPPASDLDVKRGLWISSDGRHVAYLTKDKKGIVIDGKLREFPTTNRLRHFEWSPDSQHYAYCAYVGEKGETLVLDGVDAEKGYNTISPGPVFSPDSKHVAYVARLKASEFTTALVIDGKEGPPNPEASAAWNLAFTSDSKSVLYAVEKDKKYRMLEVPVDGGEVFEQKHGPALLTIPFLRGSGGQIGYVGKDEGGQFVFFNGKDDKIRLKEISSADIRVSPDGQRVAYAGEPETFRKVVVVDGVKSKVFRDLVDRTLIFSPDSKRVAYATRDFSRFSAVIDGQEGKVYRGVDGLVFSPDSKRVAYRAIGDKAMIVVDGKEGPGYDGVGIPVFSPDSKQVAVGVKLGKREFILVNAQPDKKAYDEVGDPVFSPDGKRMAYTATTGGKSLVVEAGKEGKPYDSIDGPLLFSPDSRRLAMVVVADGKSRVVVDGAEGAPYDAIFLLGNARLRFDENSKLRYLAVKAGELFLVEEN